MSLRPLTGIIGPTASGKTDLAIAIARALGGDVLSADSRQVFRGMDIGTGKDLPAYSSGGAPVTYHMIDVVDPGVEYSVYDYVESARKVMQSLQESDTPLVLCGGSGLYIDALLSGYRLVDVPDPTPIRDELKDLSTEELLARLQISRPLHNTTDALDRDRLIRAIEVAEWSAASTLPPPEPVACQLFMPEWSPEELRTRISTRLDQRLKNGMIEEVRTLLDRGISSEALEGYGLEYRFITQHIQGQMNRNDMTQKLAAAISRYAKRQRTWFRRMERKGYTITPIPGTLSLDEQVKRVLTET